MDCRSCTILLSLLLIVAPSHQMFDDNLDLSKGNGIYDCLRTIICPQNKPLEFKRFITKIGPKTMEKAYAWMEDIYEVKHRSRDLDAYLITLAKITCPKSDAVRREKMKDFAIRFTSHYEEVCKKHLDFQECSKLKDATMAVEDLVREYTQKGICNNPEEATKMKPIG